MSEKQRPLGSRASESFQQQGPPGEREQGVGASRSKKARSKIESAVLPNAPAGPGINAPNTTEGSAEEPEKYSREEEDKVKPKVVKAIEENVEKHKSSATAYTYGADKDGADSEDKSEYGEEPSEPEPAWDVLEQGRNTHTKIIETSYGPRVLHAKSTWSHIYLALGETSIEAENYPSARNDVEVTIGSERKGQEDSRSLAEALYQPGGTQTYPGNTLEVTRVTRRGHKGSCAEEEDPGEAQLELRYYPGGGGPGRSCEGHWEHLLQAKGHSQEPVKEEGGHPKGED